MPLERSFSATYRFNSCIGRTWFLPSSQRITLVGPSLIMNLYSKDYFGSEQPDMSVSTGITIFHILPADQFNLILQKKVISIVIQDLTSFTQVSTLLFLANFPQYTLLAQTIIIFNYQIMLTLVSWCTLNSTAFINF